MTVLNTSSTLLGANIRSLREQRGLSQASLADVLAVSLDSLRLIETGAQELHLDDLQKLSDTFGVPVRNLLIAPEPN